MASKYKWNENPINDFFLQNIMNDVDISKKKNYDNIHDGLTAFLEYFLEEENDIVYLDFSIKRDKFGSFNVVANNIVTALWFTGVIPRDTNDVLKKNKFVFDDVEYTFNKRSKLLKIKNLK